MNSEWADSSLSEENKNQNPVPSRAPLPPSRDDAVRNHLMNMVRGLLDSAR
jgi:hypothetical protein